MKSQNNNNISNNINSKTNKSSLSWGNYPISIGTNIYKPNWVEDINGIYQRINNSIESNADLGINPQKLSILPYGKGRSYGDSCLNSNSYLLQMTNLNHFLELNEGNGDISNSNSKLTSIKVEAGVTFDDLLTYLIPKGYFLPVTPGTKYITVGGAIANDIHGKNHFSQGTFGNHLLSFGLLRPNSDNELIEFFCSKDENSELFNATIGGLGLTGIITWAEFTLKNIVSEYFDNESIKFSNIDEFFDINKESEQSFEYTVAWLDCGGMGKKLGRGLYYRANHSEIPTELNQLHQNPINNPITYPFINSTSVKVFNELYFSKQISKHTKSLIHYEPFFYPLDKIGKWNNLYGKNGFLQYQFVLPFGDEKNILKKIINKIANSGFSSFLTVLKTFGNIKSPGLLSFPQEGVTMAIDFRLDAKVFGLLAELDVIILDCGGRVYPAKDARMKTETFMESFPNLEEFKKYKLDNFSSDFWKRVVTKDKKQ